MVSNDFQCYLKFKEEHEDNEYISFLEKNLIKSHDIKQTSDVEYKQQFWFHASFIPA